VFIDAMNLYDCLRGALKDVFHLMTNCCSRLCLRHDALKSILNSIATFLGGLLLPKERTGAKAKNQRERGFTRHKKALIFNLRYGDAQAASDYTVPKI
jgi:hypothetical protein